MSNPLSLCAFFCWVSLHLFQLPLVVLVLSSVLPFHLLSLFPSTEHVHSERQTTIGNTVSSQKRAQSTYINYSTSQMNSLLGTFVQTMDFSLLE